jgi:hypothetical protein
MRTLSGRRLILRVPLMALLLASGASLGNALAPVSAVPAETGALSLSEYQAKLQSFDKLLAACQQAMIPANCQSEQVGGDPQLALPSGTRLVRFAWLRDLLDRAARDSVEKQKAKQNPSPKAVTTAVPSKDQDSSDAKKSGKPEDSDDSDEGELIQLQPQFQEPTLAQQLADGRKRLADEAATAARLTEQFSAQPNASRSSSENASQHRALARILEAKEYHAAVAGPSLLDRLLEKVVNWINRFLGKLAETGFKSRWIGYSAEIGFVLLLCVGLIWFLIRLERQGRLSVGAYPFGSAAVAASARDWQLWLRDARSAAARGAWREGIHLLYWASISRLESSGQWPADRARTPREYLSLLAPENTQRPELVRLTQDFERTWYAGRAAEEADFLAAEQVASKLGVKSGSQTGSQA